MENLTATPGKNEELREKFYADKPKKSLRGLLRHKFNGAWIANFQFTKETANAAIEAGEADLVSFGQYFVQNANLVEKFEKGIQPTLSFPPNLMELYYGHTALGYTDLSPYENYKPGDAAS